MEFLLILSALLSAATGAFTGTRGPEAGLRHEAAAEAVAVAEAATVAIATARSPEPGRPAAGRARLPCPLPAAVPVLGAPLATERLIE